jgi:hypothetical protein
MPSEFIPCHPRGLYPEEPFSWHTIPVLAPQGMGISPIHSFSSRALLHLRVQRITIKMTCDIPA